MRKRRGEKDEGEEDEGEQRKGGMEWVKVEEAAQRCSGMGWNPRKDGKWKAFQTQRNKKKKTLKKQQANGMEGRNEVTLEKAVQYKSIIWRVKVYAVFRKERYSLTITTWLWGGKWWMGHKKESGGSGMKRRWVRMWWHSRTLGRAEGEREEGSDSLNAVSE